MSFKKVRRVVLKWFGAGIVKNEGATSNLLEQVSQCLHFDGSVFAGFYESGWPDRLVSGTGEFVLRWAIQPCPTTLCNTSGKGDENFALSGRDDAIVKGVGRSTKILINPGEMVVEAGTGYQRGALGEGYPGISITRGWVHRKRSRIFVVETGSGWYKVYRKAGS